MAKPRVFISSSYYDLKHFRSSVDIFIEGLGFETILSEKGNIAYNPDQRLDESCYREAQTADIFVLLVGGRYGSEVSGEKKKPTHEFFERYDSITRKEYESAILRNIPTYILIESNVYTEYHTFLKNKKNEEIVYAQVDSVNIFYFIEEILAKPFNNPIHTFERFSDIAVWLKEQWAGLFRDFLNRRSQQKQLTTLTNQVAQLKAINDTLQKYLETVVSKITPEEAPNLIESEQKRLEWRNAVLRNQFYSALLAPVGVSPDQALAAISDAKSFSDFAERVARLARVSKKEVLDIFHKEDGLRADLAAFRSMLGLKPLP